MIVKLAKHAIKDSAEFFVAITVVMTGAWLFIFVVYLVGVPISSWTLSWVDVRDFLLYWFATIVLIAVFSIVMTPFAMISEWRKQRGLARQPLARPIAVWVSQDSLYVLEATRPRVCRIDGEEVNAVGFSLEGSTLNAPCGVVVTADETLHVADSVSGAVFRLAPGQDRATPVPVAAKESGDDESVVPVALALDGNDLIVGDARRGRLLRVANDRDVEVIADGLRGLRGIAVASDGTLFVSEKFADRVLRIAAAGAVEVCAGTGTSGFSGDGGPAVMACLSGPTGLAAAPDGVLYIADSGNHRVRMVDRRGIITTIAGCGIDGALSEIGQALDACLSRPTGLALWDGGLYVADTGNDRIRVVRPDGTIETLAGVPAELDG